MKNKFDLDFISSLYEKYADDLKKVREYQRNHYLDKGYREIERSVAYRSVRFLIRSLKLRGEKVARMDPQLDDLEAEITYMLIREYKPGNIVEISPCGGWSTSWILNALRDNGSGKLYSYDLVDYSTLTVPKELAEGRWIFNLGDIKQNMDKLPSRIDYLFIDSDHSADFALWYIEKLFPMISEGTPVSIHDIHHLFNPFDFYGGERRVVLDWLDQNSIAHFSASPANNKNIYETMLSIKNDLRIHESIHFGKSNPMIFFSMTATQMSGSKLQDA